MPISVVGFDCDDTLWRNEDIFLKTRQWFGDVMTPYAPPHQASDLLNETEMRNLSYFGYGVKGFTLSMIETAIHLTQGQLPAEDIPKMIEAGRKMLDNPIELLPGVRNVIEHLQGDYRLIAITKGDLLDQEKKIEKSGLAEFFDGIEIVSEKDPLTYGQILKSHKIDVNEFMMVGNSPKSDILPVLELGGYATHVPYQTTWAHEAVDLSNVQNKKFCQIDSVECLPSLLGSLKP